MIGIVSFPWKLYEDVGAYIFTWLVGYGSLLAAFLARDGLRLLDAAAGAAGPGDALRPSERGRVLVLGRLQLARARWRWRSACSRAARLPARRDDEGRRGRRPGLLRPALPLRRVRRVRHLGGDLRRAVARRTQPARSPSRRWRADHGHRRDVPDGPAREPGGRADRAGRAARLQPRVDVRLAHPVAGAVRDPAQMLAARSGSWSARSSPTRRRATRR